MYYSNHMKAYQIKNSKHEFIHSDVFIFAETQEFAQLALERVNKRLRTAQAFCVQSERGSRFPIASLAFKWLEDKIKCLELENQTGFWYEIHRCKQFS